AAGRFGPPPLRVLRQDYEPVGIVSAALMSGDWYQQHFGIGKGTLRLAAWHGPNNHPALKAGRPGEAMRDIWAIDIEKGGNAIPYYLKGSIPPHGVRRADGARRRRVEDGTQTLRRASRGRLRRPGIDVYSD